MEYERNPNSENAGIVYCVGSTFLVRALVSIWSLRKTNKWNGQVEVFCVTDNAFSLAENFSQAKCLLPLQVRRTALPGNGQSAALVAKTNLFEESPFDHTLFLDADTLVTGSLKQLFNNRSSLVLTRFSNHTTGRKTIINNINTWKGLNPRINCLINNATNREKPAINTGVFLFRKNNPNLTAWRSLAMQGINCPLADEIAIQLLLPTVRDYRIVSDAWNFSPLFGRNRKQARVLHFHGSSHYVWTSHSLKWWALLDEVWRKDIASIQKWGPKLRDPDLRILNIINKLGLKRIAMVKLANRK